MHIHVDHVCIPFLETEINVRCFKAEGRAPASVCELIALPIFNNGPNNRSQHQLRDWAYMPPGRIIGPNIVSTGLRFQTPLVSALPLPSMLRLFKHIIAAVASGPPGTESTIRQPGRDGSGFPINPLISYSCASADGDLMGVLARLGHCQSLAGRFFFFFFFF